MANNFCVDLKLPTECSKELDLTPGEDTGWIAQRVGGKILVLCSAGSAYVENMCINPVLQNGGVVGSDVPATNIDPTHTSDGTLIYSIQADTTTDEVTARFGDNGDEQLYTDDTHTNTISQIYIKHDKYSVILLWDNVSSLYRGTSIEITKSMADAVGSEYCMQALVVPDLIIDYDFKEVL